MKIRTEDTFRLKSENRYLASRYLASYKKSKKKGYDGKKIPAGFLNLTTAAAGYFLVVNICSS